MMQQSFGAWLQEARKEKGISQDALALRIGALPHVIAAIEHDSVAANGAFPRPTVLLLARVLGVEKEEALRAAGYSVQTGDEGDEDALDEDVLAEMVKVAARYLAQVRAEGASATGLGIGKGFGQTSAEVPMTPLRAMSSVTGAVSVATVEVLIEGVRDDIAARLRDVRLTLASAPSRRERERLDVVEQVLIECQTRLADL